MMAQVCFPSRCAVAVIFGEHLLSQVYPASVPVEVFIDGVVELVDEDLKRRGFPGVDAAVSYELQRTNGTRLDVSKTLDELGVEDGATLVLAPADEGEGFEPQYESLSTGLARAGRRLFAPVTSETAVAAAVAILTLCVVTVVAMSMYGRLNGQTWVPAAVTGTLGLAIAATAAAALRRSSERGWLVVGLCWQVVPLLAVSLAAAAPGAVQAAHGFIALLAVAVLASAVFAVTQRGMTFTATVVTLAGIGAAISAVRMFTQPSAHRLGLGTLVALLILLTLAPTLALWAARIRPPHFGSITGRDLFRREDGMPVDAVAPVDEEAEQEPSSDTTPAGENIARAARRANAVLTGICFAAAITLPAAVWVTLVPGQSYEVPAALTAGLFIAIFISRARAFTDRRQAVALVCGAAGAVCAAVVRYATHAGGVSPMTLLFGTALLAGLAGTGLAAALLVPDTRFTPLVRMAAEWLELALIVVAVPTAAWIAGLFTWVRMR